MASDWDIWTKQIEQGKEMYSTDPPRLPKKMQDAIDIYWAIKDAQKDPIIDRVITKFRERSKVGFKKYKVSMADNPMELKEWLVALQEELMDATNYIERIIQEVEGD